jgi:hypothetical protein
MTRRSNSFKNKNKKKKGGQVKKDDVSSMLQESKNVSESESESESENYIENENNSNNESSISDAHDDEHDLDLDLTNDSFENDSLGNDSLGNNSGATEDESFQTINTFPSSEQNTFLSNGFDSVSLHLSDLNSSIGSNLSQNTTREETSFGGNKTKKRLNANKRKKIGKKSKTNLYKKRKTNKLIKIIITKKNKSFKNLLLKREKQK